MTKIQKSEPKTTAVRTAYLREHYCSTQYSTEQFWQSFFLSSRQSSLLRRCL